MSTSKTVSKIIAMMPRAIAELKATGKNDAAGLIEANQKLLEDYFRGNGPRPVRPRKPIPDVIIGVQLAEEKKYEQKVQCEERELCPAI